MSTTAAAVKAAYLALEPVEPGDVPNGCLFLDITNSNALTQKSSNGTVGIIASSANNNPFMKQMVAGEAFPANKPLAKRADGKVVLADSQDATRTVLIGYSMAASLGNNSIVNVFCIGSNLSGVLSGLGFTPGQTIFLGEAQGTYTNNVATFTGNNDVYMKIGIADCAAGLASGLATDLIVNTQFISSDI